MKTKTNNSLPKTVGDYEGGALLKQSVRCGKACCGCAEGPLHEGYYYFFRRTNGRLTKTYVLKADVPKLMKIIRSAQSERRRQRTIERGSAEVLRTIKAKLREHLPTTKIIKRGSDGQN